MKAYSKYIAEFLGTFILSYIVVMSLTTDYSVVTPVLAGLTLMLFVYTVGNISGTHINPAVTIAMLTRGKINSTEAFFYIVVQLSAATLAMILFNQSGRDLPVDTAKVGTVFLAETLGTMIFAFGIMAVVNQKVSEGLGGIVIGGSLLLGISLAAVIGSAGLLNPAVAVPLEFLNWQYLLSPVLGAVLGVTLYEILLGKPIVNLRVVK